jgi:ketosteroid isomerase-like protein
MTIQLPKPLAAYFDADRNDPDAVARCFSEDAVVTDEGRTHTGRAAIQAWKRQATAKYRYTCEPTAAEQKDGRILVTCRLTGSFPGSPLNLRYFFKLAGDEIAALEIVP